MKLMPALLEEWLREHYFTAELDLGSSGVPCWSFAEFRDIVGLDPAELDGIRFDDSDSFGSGRLRKAIADRFGDGDPDRVMATHGSSEAVFLAMASLLNPGDEVVVVSPGYHALSATAAGIGCRIVPWRLREARGFAADLDALRGLLRPATAMVVVNFPHNPTGVTLTPDEQSALIDLVAGHGAYLLWDGAFTELTYDAAPLPDPAHRYDRCLSVGTMSKAYGLPGLRLGWCLAAPALLEQFLPLRDRTSICLSPLVERLAWYAVSHADRLVTTRRAQAAANRDVLAGWLAARAGTVDCPLPMGGVTAFLRLPLPETDRLCLRLSREHGVLLVPGSCFGHPDRVRLGFGGPRTDFAEGLARVASALADH
jgi:capreomycidine synthase